MNRNIIKNRNFLRILLLGSAVLTVSACAERQPNPQVIAAQARLANDYGDKETAERGQADLAQADEALRAADDHWKQGDKSEFQHHLRMGETYLDLAETRGQQARIEAETTKLKQQSALAEKDRQLANAEQQAARAQEELRDYHMKVTELGSMLVLQDVSFATGKADLRPGAANRLEPLEKFLRESPNTRVQIEGHTDNVGGAAYNRDLSLARANSVKSALVQSGIDPDRITTIGSGFSKPIASNDTVSGREQNRRVEITLLK